MQLSAIQSKFFELRVQRVMLDFDLAEMYGIETKRLKETVKRNMNFPADFMFEVTKEEFTSLRSQNASSKEEAFVQQNREVIGYKTGNK